MCGIWAFIKNFDNKFNPEEYEKLLPWINKVQARGPDKSSLIKLEKYYLAFHRLAIHDLSILGDQPFVFHDKTSVIYLMCNGEIYNYQELINEYNIKMKSHSDCEVIYHLYKLFNHDIEKLLNKLDGEFAFIMVEHNLVDNNVRTIVARDPIGVRPLFWGSKYDGEIFSSNLAGLSGLAKDVQVFKPGHYLILNSNNLSQLYVKYDSYYKYNYPTIKVNNKEQLYWEITSRLINAVKKRLDSDRPIGCLLSGGLDSSLVAAIMVKILGVKNLRTFNISMEEGTDLKYARIVASHLNTIHTEVKFTPEEGLKVIPDVIKATESWDITTTRASVGQYLISKYISNNTDIKVLMNGDGADEVEMGYMYFYNHPNLEEAHIESIKLVEEIHRFDGLRVDRCISQNGLEARLPFLDPHFLNYYLSIPVELRVPIKGKQMEKQLIRDAFAYHYPDLLPEEVLYRKKDAFSDGISSKKKSWYEIIQEYVELKITNLELLESKKYNYNQPVSKEALYYRKIFDNIFDDKYANVIPHYWLPNWSNNITEPSARVLSVYNN